jgi:hypothetical protein
MPETWGARRLRVGPGRHLLFSCTVHLNTPIEQSIDHDARAALSGTGRALERRLSGRRHAYRFARPEVEGLSVSTLGRVAFEDLSLRG